MKSNDAMQPIALGARSDAALDGLYGKIGISAVAAALRYQSETKNPAYAPVRSHLDPWAAELAEMTG
jgi:hypothetical protein